MEKFSKNPPENIASGIIDNDAQAKEVEQHLIKLASQTNADTLFIFKLAEYKARDHHDMELFLTARKKYAEERLK